MKHVIKKQQLLVTIPPGMDPFLMQHTADRFYRDILMPALDRIFGELSGEDEVIHLDHLHIDLGRIGETLLQTRVMDQYLYELIKQQVRETIEKELADRPSARQSLRASVLGQWWYYMQHGRLPWNADPITADWYRKVLEMFSVDFPAITKLRRVLLEQPAVLMRISTQHDDWFLQQLVTVLVSAAQDDLVDAIEQACLIQHLLEERYRALSSGSPIPGNLPAHDVHNILVRDPGARPPSGLPDILRRWSVRHTAFLRLSPAEQKQYLWRWILTEAASHPSDFANAGGLKIILHWNWDHPTLMHLVLSDDRLAGSPSQFIKLLRLRYEVLSGKPAPSGHDDSPATHLPKPDTTHSTPLPTPTTPGDISTAIPAADDAGPKTPTRPGAPDDIEALIKTAGSDAGLVPDTDETIYLPHAGIILLHPFLSTLFTRLGYWDGSDFRDGHTRHRAISLLHFLATGEQRSPPEYQLVLPKLLCGYPLDMPVPADIMLADEECAECLTLLRGAIARWDKLAGTSIDGLRESFLRRDGQLTRKNDRLILKVQSAGIDVLLDYLPWNLSLVKLPWLKDILYVEWR